MSFALNKSGNTVTFAEMPEIDAEAVLVREIPADGSRGPLHLLKADDARGRWKAMVADGWAKGAPPVAPMPASESFRIRHGIDLGEVNPLPHAMRDLGELSEGRVDLDEPGLKVIRLRLLGDRGYPFLDVSYCWGVIKTATGFRVVDVSIPIDLPARGWKAALVKWGIAHNVNVKATGVFDAVSSLTC